MQGDASIEEWELFADPRELERRKAERRRAAQPPEVRVNGIVPGSVLWFCCPSAVTVHVAS